MTFLVLVPQFFVFATFAEVSEDDAASALANAEGALVSAYQAALKAEEAGADVSGLLVRLNEAGGFLAQARIAYRLGDFDEAVRLADLCSESSDGVGNEAVKLRLGVFGPRVMGFWLTVTYSLVGVVAVVLGSFWGWHFFKRRYFERVLRMKPEVSFDES